MSFFKVFSAPNTNNKSVEMKSVVSHSQEYKQMQTFLQWNDMRGYSHQHDNLVKKIQDTI